MTGHRPCASATGRRPSAHLARGTRAYLGHPAVQGAGRDPARAARRMLIALNALPSHSARVTLHCRRAES